MFVEVLPEHVPLHLETLSRSKILEDFYMAGGTGLALQLGHRRSVDLDFFSLRDIAPSYIATKVASFGHFAVDSMSSGTLHGLFNGIKISFFNYPYPLIKDLHNFSGISIADPVDIGCMKIDAISSRGSCKDFIDLYFICNEIISLREMLEFFDQKYKGIEYNKVHILKSLVYFNEAEQEPTPLMLKRMVWDEVKEYFINQVKDISNEWL